jgi:restriction system protein
LPTTVRNVKPLPCGLRTHRSNFIIPILMTLYDLGGEAPIQQVMSGVEERMRGTLNRFDYEILNSGKGRVERRWRNTARWAKDVLIKLGLVDGNSPTGLWELTYKGENFAFQLR